MPCIEAAISNNIALSFQERRVLTIQSIRMGENIEKYLTEKFKENFHSTPKVLFYGRFRKMQSLLDKIPDSQSYAERSIKEELYSLNDALEECQMLSRKHGLTSLPTILSPSVFQIHRTLDKIEGELKSIANSNKTGGLLPERLETSGGSSSRVIPARNEVVTSPGSSSQVDSSRIHGLENEVVTLERMLLQKGKPSDHLNAIAIIGMRGVGKTTVAQLVYNKREVKAHFLPRIWVSLSPQLYIAEDPREAIIRKLLARLGVERDIISSIKSHGLRGLLYALHLQLLGKRYLIVLDDVWDTNKLSDNNARKTSPWYDKLYTGRIVKDEWHEQLGYGLPKGYGGSVIITSRSEALANTMVERDNVLRLQPLEDSESCWSIFKDKVEKDGEKLNDDNIEKLKLDVTKKSAGLPLAAKVMGEIFYEKRRAREVGEHDGIYPEES